MFLSDYVDLCLLLNVFLTPNEFGLNWAGGVLVGGNPYLSYDVLMRQYKENFDYVEKRYTY